MKSVDPDGALKMYMESGEWDKCLELAKQQVRRHTYLKKHTILLCHSLLSSPSFPSIVSLPPLLLFIGS